MMPQSLFGRLFAALVAVILISVLVAALLIARDRRELSMWGTASWSAAREIAAASVKLGGLHGTDRARAVATLEREPIKVGDSPRRIQRPVQDTTAIERDFAAQVRRQLQRGYDVSAGPAQPRAGSVIRVESERALLRPAINPPPGLDDTLTNAAAGTARPAPPPSPRGVPARPSAPLMDVQIRLPDGDRLVFRTFVPPPRPPLPQGIFLQLAILTLILGATLFFMTRSITRPLSNLAEAADAIGRGQSPPPLPERGARELRDATRAFNTMQDRLRRYLDSRSRVLAAMSHDMRTSLTRLRLRVESVDPVDLRERVVADVDEMTSMVHEALALLKGLNDEERIEPVDVDALLRTVQAECAEAGESVSIEGHARGPLPAKPRALKRCIENLVQNAVKYGTRASVRVTDGAALVITICDEGPGIPEDMLEQVFEPFLRVEPSRNPDTGGSGLGLSIARDIAQAHGGTVQLKNRAGGGLEALLTLPRTR